jgi:enoyl-CoA hydratase/carnithine racemase
MVLTGRVLEAEEALGHRVVTRLVSLDRLDQEGRVTAVKIAAAPAVTVRAGGRILHHHTVAEMITAMEEEIITQTLIAGSDDLAELRSSRAEDPAPQYRGS